MLINYEMMVNLNFSCFFYCYNEMRINKVY